VTTYCEKWNGSTGRVEVRYQLQHDSKGWYFDGLNCKSFRRRTREGAEANAKVRQFYIVDIVSTRAGIIHNL